MRLKDVTEFCPAYTGAARNDAVAFVPMEALRYDSIAQQEIPFEEARGKYTFFADGDLLFAKVTPCFENGNIAIANNLKGGIGFGSSEIFVLRAKPGLNNRYLFYIVQASPFMDGGCATMCGVGGLKRMSPLFPRTFEWEIPSEESQRKIVAYLDEKTAAIDARVAVLEKKLLAYKRLKASVINRAVTRGLNPKAKLKDSGVDWIGKVPVGWEVRRIGSLYDQRSAKVSDRDYLPLSVSKQGIVPQMESVAKTGNGDDRKLVKAGDFVINSRSDRRGACGIADRDGSVSVINIVLAPRNAMNPQYYNWLFHTTMFGDEFYNKGNGIVDDLWSTRWSDMKSISIVVPPLSEQHIIADYLDAECAKIDKMSELVTREIELYKKLKRSLINEVVTGKRTVV